METELNGIGTNGYYVIYWIASVLVRQVNASNHLVGSRGSVGSSLVATMSGITEVNPLPPYWLCQNANIWNGRIYLSPMMDSTYQIKIVLTVIHLCIKTDTTFL